MASSVAGRSYASIDCMSDGKKRRIATQPVSHHGAIEKHGDFVIRLLTHEDRFRARQLHASIPNVVSMRARATTVGMAFRSVFARIAISSGRVRAEAPPRRASNDGSCRRPTRSVATIYRYSAITDPRRAVRIERNDETAMP